MGGIKKMLGLKGKTKPGEMVKRYNDIKSGKLKMKTAVRKPKVLVKKTKLVVKKK